MLGEHNEYVLSELLGIDEADIARMYETSAIGKEPVSPGSARATNLKKQVDEGVIAGIDPDYRKKLRI